MGIWKNIRTHLKPIGATQKYSPFGQNFIFLHLVFCKHPLFTNTIEFKNKQAGAELCQAQGKLRLDGVWLNPFLSRLT